MPNIMNTSNGIILCLLLSFAACDDKSPRVSEAQMTQINELVATAELDFNANLKSWRQQVRGLAVGTLPVTEELCPTEELEDLPKDITVRMPELDTLVPTHLEDLERALKKSHETLEHFAEKKKRLYVTTFQMLEEGLNKQPREAKGHLVLIVEDELKPKMIDGKTYEAGHIKGRLLWWKRSAGMFTCAAQVEALSDEKIKAYGNKNRSLQGNLEYRARQVGLKKFLRLK